MVILVSLLKQVDHIVDGSLHGGIGLSPTSLVEVVDEAAHFHRQVVLRVEPWYVFTNGASSQSFMAFPKAVPSGANFLKCVSYNAEDVSEVHIMSHIQLHVQAKAKTCVLGTIYNCLQWACSVGASTGQGQKTDDQRDWKHLIAYEGTELAAFRNQCVGITLNPIQVPPGKSVTSTVFCYYSNRTDYEVY